MIGGPSSLLCRDYIHDLTLTCINHTDVFKFETMSNENNFHDGALGSLAFLQYATWKNRRRQKEGAIDGEEEIEELLEGARFSAYQCLDHLLLPSSKLSEERDQSTICSIWTNSVFGTRVLLSVIHHRLHQGEASYQQLDHVENFLEKCTEQAYTQTSCNLLKGLAGTLQAIFFLRQELQRPDWGKSHAIRIALHILKVGQQKYRANRNLPPLSWKLENGSNGEGVQVDWSVSTGSAGILLTLLGLEMNEWIEVEEKKPNALETLVEPTIRLLPAYVKLDYYSTLPKNQNWTMDGASGHVTLLLQAYVILGSIDYLRQAQTLVQSVILPHYDRYLTGIIKMANPLGLFDGLVGICYTLWLIKERNSARKLAEFALDFCQEQELKYAQMDIALATGVAGFILLLQHFDHTDGNTDNRVGIPFLSSALFDFVIEKHKPITIDGEYNYLNKRGNKLGNLGHSFVRSPGPNRQLSLPVTRFNVQNTYGYENPQHQQKKCLVSSLSCASNARRRTSMSDLDADSHVSVSSVSLEDSHSPLSKKDRRLLSVAVFRRSTIGHSVGDLSYLSKEEDVVNQDVASNLFSESRKFKDDDNNSDGSSSFSNSSHMENASQEDLACPHYLAKQDSDNEEYEFANKSKSLLSLDRRRPKKSTLVLSIDGDRDKKT
jgi:hypothetical protein